MHTPSVSPFCSQNGFSVPCQPRAFGSPGFAEHLTRSLPLILQGTPLPQPPLGPQATLSDLFTHSGRHPGSEHKIVAKSLGHTQRPGPGRATCQVPLTTRLGQLAQAFLLPQVVLCLWEVFFAHSIYSFGPPQGWPAGIDCVM